jgi:hypothetical protein
MKRLCIFYTLAIAIACHAVRADDKAKLNDLIAHAEKGDSAAQLSLAIAYRDGNGVDKDLPQAMHWAHLAADQGSKAAMDFIGFAYLTGRGAKRNPAVAFGYFHAAAGTSARAAFNLGQCYFAAQGTEQDVPKAMAAWKKAAEMGDGRAASNAAMVYLSGEGIAADPLEALRLATRAAQLGDASGLVVLGEIQFQAGQIDEARNNWQKASRIKPVGQTGQPTQPNDFMSAQEGADLLKLIDYRHRKSEPGVFAYVEAPHIHQGYNNCGATATAMLARFQSSKVGGWDLKRMCKSPLGTGTDWGELMAAAGKIGLQWKLVTFTPDNEGFEKATAFARSEIDAGRPLVIDFRYTGPQFPGGAAGHTLDLVGYIAAEHLYILRNPAIATPGLELMAAEDLKHYWQSNSYGSMAHGIMSRPAIAIDRSEPGSSDRKQ